MASGNETAATSMSKIKWHNYLSQTEIRSAQEEAERRMEAINNRIRSAQEEEKRRREAVRNRIRSVQ